MADDDTARQGETVRMWTALGGGAELTERITEERAPTVLDRAALPAATVARATVAVCALAAAELAAARGGGPVPRVRVADRAVADAFRSDRLIRLEDRGPVTFAPLSGFWRAADGWVRTHANYPHHRARLLGALGLPEGAGPGELAAALAGRGAAATEEAVYAAGGLAVAVRDRAAWARHPQGVAAARQPLAERRPLAPGAPPLPPSGRAPGYAAAGLRVLDLTRVLAGPVATRTLALLGADVLRLDAPWLPESQDALDDTGLGKRSARLDLATADGRAVFGRLLETADVVVTGYRPGALEALPGMAPGELAARRPGLVVAQLSAWGWSGPWAGRRGFDSLVQAASGVAVAEAGPGAADGTPGALPAQALDHGTGYLLAAAVLRALTRRHRTGEGSLLRLSLARTAHGLLRADAPERAPARDGGGEPLLREAVTARGTLRYVPSPVEFEGGPRDWSRTPGLWGTDAPRWEGTAG
ncbi:CoA transferase [Streptomyces sp. NPDC058374]|uniref:CoA transferase n=1 Tax=unclassified Streptomyces TaxID=2593676 RepID=UPI003649409C